MGNMPRGERPLHGCPENHPEGRERLDSLDHSCSLSREGPVGHRGQNPGSLSCHPYLTPGEPGTGRPKQGPLDNLMPGSDLALLG